MCLSTFAFAGAEAAALLAGGGGALADGRHLLVALKAWDFTVHLIGQVPQQTNTVLYQLQMWNKIVQCREGTKNKKQQLRNRILPSYVAQLIIYCRILK